MIREPMFKPPVLYVSLLLAGLLPQVDAGIVVQDPFTDGSRSNTTGGDTLGAVWWQSANAPGAVTVVDDSSGIGSGSALQLVPTGDFHKLLMFFPAVTLAA